MQTQNAAMQDKEQVKETPLAQSIKQDFETLNERQTRLIQSISEKLHDIINKRVPSAEEISKQDGSIADFHIEIGKEFQKMRYNTNRLEDILVHLQSII